MINEESVLDVENLKNGNSLIIIKIDFNEKLQNVKSV